MELYKVMLTNNAECYVIGEDESQARDKIKDWIRERYMLAAQIASMDLIAESNTKGFVEKLIL